MDHAEADEALSAWQDWTTDQGAQAAQREHALSCRDCQRKVAALSRSSRGTANALPWLQAMAAEAPKPQRSSLENKDAVDASLREDARAYLKASRSLVKRCANADKHLALAPKDVASLLIRAASCCLTLPAKGNTNHTLLMKPSQTRSGSGGYSKAAARAYQQLAAARILAPPLRCFLAVDPKSTLEGCRAAVLSEALETQGQNDQRAIIGVLVTLLREAKAASRLSESDFGGGDDDGDNDDDDNESDNGFRRNDSESEAESLSADENDAESTADDKEEFALIESNSGGLRRREKIRARAALANLPINALVQHCDPFTALELFSWRFATPASTLTLACFLCGEVGHLKRDCPRNLARQPKTLATQEKYGDICPTCGIARMPRYKSLLSFQAHQKHCSGVPPTSASADDGVSSNVAAITVGGVGDQGQAERTLTAAPSASEAHDSKTANAVRCKFFVAGKCRNGFACEFQHSLPEQAHMTVVFRKPQEEQIDPNPVHASKGMASAVEATTSESGTDVERRQDARTETAAAVAKREEAGRLWALARAAEVEWWQRRSIQGPSLGAPVEFLALEAGRMIEGRRARKGGLRLEAWVVRSSFYFMSVVYDLSCDLCIFMCISVFLTHAFVPKYSLFAVRDMFRASFCH